MIFCDSFLLNMKTLMLQAVFTGSYRSKIITTQGEFFSTMTVRELLDLTCIRFASTLEGRIQASKKMMRYFNKSPIIINPGEMGALPTKSYKAVDCIWIFNHFFHVDEISAEESLITFRNGFSYKIPCSKYILIKQQQRLHTLLNAYSTIKRDEELAKEL